MGVNRSYRFAQGVNGHYYWMPESKSGNKKKRKLMVVNRSYRFALEKQIGQQKHPSVNSCYLQLTPPKKIIV